MESLKSHFKSIGIQKLSNAQRHNLMGGKKVRVKHGQHTEIMVTDEQHKHIMKNHRGGRAAEIHFSKLQQDVHRGAGFFDSLKSTLNTVANSPITQEIAKQALPIAAKYAEKKILGDGMKHKGKKGKGFLDDLKNTVMPIAQEVGKAALPIALEFGKKKLLGGKCPHCGGALNPAGGGALNPAGYGMHQKKRGRPKKGGDIGNDILSGLKTGISTVAPLLPLLF
jgi:hypothetical protein